jgi:branched-chain amino acid transport system ATP-binding protein/urea transport system ATP-binding protein
MLRVRALTKSFGGVKANSDVDLDVTEGSIRCVIGPNGAGKSTFVSMLSGHVRPDAGSIHFRGKEITNWPAHRVAKAGMVRKFQRPSFYPDLSVAENLEIAVLATRARGRRLRLRVEEVAESVRLSDALGTRAAHLPHGRTQWLEVGMLIGRGSRLMLLDEPTAGMTPEETSTTAALVRRLVDDQGVSAIVIEHDMSFVRSLESDVTVLHLGRVIAAGPMSEIARDSQVQAVYLGEEVA